jgi:hypothetical protein
MVQPWRLVSTALLALGVLMVFAGLTRAFGFTLVGIVATIAAIAALLYVGGVWFGAPAAAPPAAAAATPLLVFDRDRRVVSGPTVGQPLSLQFPEILRAEIEQRCRMALAGTATRFPCLHNGRMVVFDAIPVRTADGTIVYGILLSSDVEPAATAASV